MPVSSDDMIVGGHKRFCRRCGKRFNTPHKWGKICEDCKLPMGGKKESLIMSMSQYKEAYGNHKKEREDNRS